MCSFVHNLNGQTSTFIKNIVANVTNHVELTDQSNLSLNPKGLYRIKMDVPTTGTRTGTEYIAWYDGPSSQWKVRLVSASALNSNHPTLEVENNVVKVATQHSTAYNIRIFVEFYDVGGANVFPHLFGASYQWQRIGNALFYQDGNVGIGIQNPTVKLGVKGTIKADEIKVTTTDWPDYVFKPNYSLIPLAQVKSFIYKNGHLPEVPTAEQIENEGQSLGEINKILLKKIEELTLYQIQLEERLDKLESKNN